MKISGLLRLTLHWSKLVFEGRKLEKDVTRKLRVGEVDKEFFPFEVPVLASEFHLNEA